MAWYPVGNVPMFPNYYDFGAGSGLNSGLNAKNKWRVKNTHAQKTITITINANTPGGNWDNSHGANYTIAPGVSWDLTGSYITAPATDSLGVKATTYDDYGYLEVWQEIQKPPTTPGTFTQPTGTLEIGGAKVFTVGASTDADGNLSKYVWEASVNGGAYTKVGETTVPNLTYTIPTATSLKMRVKAVDAGGLESAYRESSAYTVSKPVYYWNKYNVGTYNSYYQSEWYREEAQNSNLQGMSKSYDLNTATGIFTVSGGIWDNSAHPLGATGYSASGTNMYRRVMRGDGVSCDLYSSYSHPRAIETPGSLVQSGLTAIEGTFPLNGKHTDGFWYVRGSRVNQSIAPPGKFTAPTTGKLFKSSEVATITFEASSAASIAAYEVDYRYGTGAWAALAYNTALTRSLTITTNKELKTLELRVRAKNTSNVYSDYVYSESFSIEHNVAPTVSLTNPGDNTTLYENDTFNIGGTVLDADNGNTITVRYQINATTVRAIKAYLSDGVTLGAFSKSLTFKGGNLYDGTILIAENLTGGVAYTLKVWATDDQGGTSAIREIPFYVVPNRAPLLTVNSPVINGLINSDKFTVDGTFEDSDGNTTIVSYRINGATSVQIAEGVTGSFTFEVKFGQLVIGENQIVIDAVDSYGAKVSKTVKLNKAAVETPLLKSTARYKINPPKGNAQAVLLWIQRDENLDMDVSISMTMVGEAESFVALPASNTAPIDQGLSIVEDEFYYEADGTKDNIIIKIDMERALLEVSYKIYLISGVLD